MKRTVTYFSFVFSANELVGTGNYVANTNRVRNINIHIRSRLLWQNNSLKKKQQFNTPQP